MTVRELLDRIDSRELAEWDAFERAYGPLGNSYEHEALASIQEELQKIQYIIGMGHFGEENPVPKPDPYPRPRDVFKEKVEDDSEYMDQAEFDKQFDD